MLSTRATLATLAMHANLANLAMLTMPFPVHPPGKQVVTLGVDSQHLALTGPRREEQLREHRVLVRTRRIRRTCHAMVAALVACAHVAHLLRLPSSPPCDRVRRAVLSKCGQVQSWFDRHHEDLAGHVAAQGIALLTLGLEVRDMGATNVNERGEKMYNQCFYLSLARPVGMARQW